MWWFRCSAMMRRYFQGSRMEARRCLKSIFQDSSVSSTDAKAYGAWRMSSEAVTTSKWFPDLTEDELNQMAEDAVKNNGFIVSYAQSNFNMLSSMATSFVQSATIAVTNVAAIAAVAASGFAAPASAPMMVSLKAQAEALKSQGAMLLSLAVGAGIELPDSVLTAIKSLDKIPG